MNVDLKKISTESRNANTLDIDIVPTIDILRKINKKHMFSYKNIIIMTVFNIIMYSFL